MVFSKAIALAAIFATLASAAPLQQKRAVVYETVTEVDITTIDTTITIYPGEPTPTVSDAVAAVTTTAVAVTSVPAAQEVASAPSPSPSSSSSSSSTSTPIYVPAPQTLISSSTSTPEPVPATVAPTTTAPPAAPAAPAPTTIITSVASSSSSSTTSTSSTSSAPSPSSPGGSTGGSALSGTGDGTYYDTATSMTNPSYCDTANNGESENVVALSHAVMNQSLCGATITVSYEGKTATGTVVDMCPGCNAESIDMSRAMFGDLSDLGAGRITVSWSVN